MHSFQFRELRLISFTFDSQFLYELRRVVWFISLKLCEIFDSVPFLLNFILLLNKKHRLFEFKTFIIPFKITVIEKPQTVLMPDL